jgi:hypothetical protein
MRPPIWRPSKRYYTTFGEKFITVIVVILFALLAGIVFFAYSGISPFLR